jgi:predicted Zn-dependent peptidase
MVFAADTFASRAGQVVRDELGLAYYVFSTISGTAAQGPWTVRMGVNPENVERAIAVTFTELKKIRDGAVADDDLALARDKLVGELEVGRESPSGVAGMVLEAELFHLGDDHLDRYPRDLRAVTKADVVAIASELLPIDRYALAIAGPEIPAAS